MKRAQLEGASGLVYTGLNSTTVECYVSGGRDSSAVRIHERAWDTNGLHKGPGRQRYADDAVAHCHIHTLAVLTRA